MKNMASVQQRMPLWLISIYHTISLGTTLLLEGIASIWLLAKERANAWERHPRKDETATQLDIKGKAHAALLQEWQGNCNAYPKGEWTHAYKGRQSMDNARTWKTQLLDDAGTQWTRVLRRLVVKVQKAERFNLLEWWHRIRPRGTYIFPRQNLHGGAGPTTTENCDILRARHWPKSCCAVWNLRTRLSAPSGTWSQRREKKKKRCSEVMGKHVCMRLGVCVCVYVCICVNVCVCVFACVHASA